MKLSFLSLASGSSGNCYYLGTPDYGILIDAGIGIRVILKVLKDNNIDFNKIMGVLVTHDHTDHIKTIGCLGEKYNLPIYATETVHKGIEKSRYVEETLTTSRRVINKEEPFMIRDMRITAFEVPHDSSDCVGYLIECFGHRFVIATDCGHITPTVSRYIDMADLLVIECNYDEEMLRGGFYPQYLKDRISGPDGHLSNHSAAEYLAEHYHPELRYIWLCHLSRDNNHPELAYKTVTLSLLDAGIRAGHDVVVTALKRSTPSDLFTFD